MPTHQEVHMVSCTVCREAKGRAKMEVSTASATTVESKVIRPSSVIQKVEKQKERERRETAKVGMTVKVAQSERDGLKVKVGTHHVKVGSNKDQQERRNLTTKKSSVCFSNPTYADINFFEKGNTDLCELEQNTSAPLPKPLVVDSGAGETVMPVDWLTSHPLTESNGQEQMISTQQPMAKVYNEGQRKLDVCTLDGHQRRSMTFQVARVKKALGSVSQMVKNGNKLVFDQDSSGKDTSYIQNKRSNEKIWLRQENGVYVLDLMVAPPQRSNDRSTEPHFHRQG